MDATAEIGRDPVSKHEIKPEYGERAGWRGTRLPNPSHETKFSSANEHMEILFSLFSRTRAGLATHPVDPYSAVRDDHKYRVDELVRG